LATEFWLLAAFLKMMNPEKNTESDLKNSVMLRNSETTCWLNRLMLRTNKVLHWRFPKCFGKSSMTA
jgi:hypothetical protein